MAERPLQQQAVRMGLHMARKLIVAPWKRPAQEVSCPNASLLEVTFEGGADFGERSRGLHVKGVMMAGLL